MSGQERKEKRKRKEGKGRGKGEMSVVRRERIKWRRRQSNEWEREII